MAGIQADRLQPRFRREVVSVWDPLSAVQKRVEFVGPTEAFAQLESQGTLKETLAYAAMKELASTEVEKEPFQQKIDEVFELLPSAIENGQDAVLAWVIDYANAAQGIFAQAQRDKNLKEVEANANWRVEEALSVLQNAGYKSDFEHNANSKESHVLYLISTAMQRFESGKVPLATTALIADKFGVLDADQRTVAL